MVSSAQMIPADMVPDAPGIWLYHCHISDHMLAGMTARHAVATLSSERFGDQNQAHFPINWPPLEELSKGPLAATSWPKVPGWPAVGSLLRLSRHVQEGAHKGRLRRVRRFGASGQPTLIPPC